MAQLVVIGSLFVTGFVALNTYYIMDSIEATRDAAEVRHWAFCIWPSFNFGVGLVRMSLAFWQREDAAGTSRPFNWDVAGAPLAYLYCQSIVYMTLLLVSDGAAVGRPIGSCQKALYGSWEHFALWGYGVRTVDGALVLNDGLDDSRQVQDADVEHERVAITKIQDCSSHRIPIVCRDAWKVYLPPNSDVFGLFSGLFFRWIRGFCR